MSDGLPGLASSTSRHTRLWMSGWWLLGLLILTVVLLAVLGEQGRIWLRLERALVLQGEYWRLITGHLVHLGWIHLFWNLVGVALLVRLFPDHYSLRQWLLIVLLCLLAVDVGLVFLKPQLIWYVGMSGVLHGLVAAGGVAWWRYEIKRLPLALSVILLSKLAWEQWRGPVPLTGADVVVDAHLYGAIGGALAGLIVWLRTRGQVPEGPDDSPEDA